jgi:hypothetical protein
MIHNVASTLLVSNSSINYYVDRRCYYDVPKGGIRNDRIHTYNADSDCGYISHRILSYGKEGGFQ